SEEPAPFPRRRARCTCVAAMRAALVVAGLIVFSSCGPPERVLGNGDVTSSERALGALRLVRVQLEADVIIEVGSPASLQLTGEGNLFPFIESTNFLGELTLAPTPRAELRPTQPLHLLLTVPSLEVVELDAPGTVRVQALEGTACRATVRSTATLVVEHVEGARLTAEALGAGDLLVRGGKVESLQLALDSSGGVLAAGLEAVDVRAVVTSSGSAEVWATRALEVELSSSGSVRYRGEPKLTSRRTSTGTVSPSNP
ncbi:MAG TPA: DUF2807 domain-containing protein, partial [Archangium sp.]